MVTGWLGPLPSLSLSCLISRGLSRREAEEPGRKYLGGKRPWRGVKRSRWGWCYDRQIDCCCGMGSIEKREKTRRKATLRQEQNSKRLRNNQDKQEKEEDVLKSKTSKTMHYVLYGGKRYREKHYSSDTTGCCRGEVSLATNNRRSPHGSPVEGLAASYAPMAKNSPG